MSPVSSEAQKGHTSAIAVKLTVAALAITSMTLAALYYQASRDLALQKTTITALQLEIAKEAARAAELKSDLNTARTVAQAFAAKSARLSSEVETKEQALAAEKSRAESAQAALHEEKSRLPSVPVRIEIRRSVMGNGLVAMFTNTSAAQLSVMMTARNPTTQAINQRPFQIALGKKVEIGHLEGIQFASGDEVRLQSAGFGEIRYTVQ